MVTFPKRTKVSLQELYRVEDQLYDVLIELKDGNSGCKTGWEYDDEHIIEFITYFQLNDLLKLNTKIEEVFPDYLNKSAEDVLQSYKDMLVIKEIIE